MVLENVKQYTDLGFRVFACHLNKTPATKNGFQDASDDFEIVKTQFYKDDLLIGLPTGQMNGLAVIDIDVGKDGDIRSRDEIFEELKKYGDIPDTLTVITPSGGMHKIFRIQEGDIIPSARRFFDKTLSVDTRGEGGYVIAADFNRYFPQDIFDFSEIIDAIADIPRWIVDFKKQQPSEQQVETTTGGILLLPASEVREIRSALSYLDADDRDIWVKVGMALKNTGTDQAKGLWVEWAQRSDKFKPEETDKRWKGLKPRSDMTIASIFHWAKEKGWVTTYSSGSSSSPENIPIVQSTDINEREIIDSFKKPKFPTQLLRPPGLVGEIVDYMNSQAFKEQPILHVAAALSFCGALMGRKFQTPEEVRTNIYCVGIGETGCGKENARSSIKKIASNSNTNGMLSLCSMEEIASDSAIYSALAANPSQVFLLDEVGRMLQTTKSTMKSPHLQGIPTVLLKAFSSSNVFMSGKSYADTKRNIVINNPNLCIYATSTPEQFYNSLTQDNLEDGLVARMLIFEAEEELPRLKDEVIKYAPSKDIIEKVDFLFNCPTDVTSTGNLAGQLVQSRVNPLTVEFTKDAKELMKEFSRGIDDLRIEMNNNNKKVHVVYNRTALYAQKIALILSISDAFNDKNKIITPFIKPEHVEYATTLSKFLFDNLVLSVDSHVANSEYEQQVKKTLNIIRQHGSISHAELTRRTQFLRSQVRKDIIETLKDSNQVEEVNEQQDIGDKTKFIKKYIAIV